MSFSEAEYRDTVDHQIDTLKAYRDTMIALKYAKSSVEAHRVTMDDQTRRLANRADELDKLKARVDELAVLNDTLKGRLEEQDKLIDRLNNDLGCEMRDNDALKDNLADEKKLVRSLRSKLGIQTRKEKDWKEDWKQVAKKAGLPPRKKNKRKK